MSCKYYILFLLIAGCSSKKDLLNDSTVHYLNFNIEKAKEYSSTGIIDNEFKPIYGTLSIYHENHSWLCSEVKDIIGQPLEEYTRVCGICQFKETFIIKK